jgi:hypothetical protein
MPRNRPEEVEPLLIDRAAAADIPAEAALRDWARAKLAFILSLTTQTESQLPLSTWYR